MPSDVPRPHRSRRRSAALATGARRAAGPAARRGDSAAARRQGHDHGRRPGQGHLPAGQAHRAARLLQGRRASTSSCSASPPAPTPRTLLLAGQVEGVVGFYDHTIDLQTKGKCLESVVQFAEGARRGRGGRRARTAEHHLARRLQGQEARRHQPRLVDRLPHPVPRRQERRQDLATTRRSRPAPAPTFIAALKQRRHRRRHDHRPDRRPAGQTPARARCCSTCAPRRAPKAALGGALPVQLAVHGLRLRRRATSGDRAEAGERLRQDAGVDRRAHAPRRSPRRCRPTTPAATRALRAGGQVDACRCSPPTA